MKTSKWINTVDTHTDGQSTRIITSGIGPIPGKSMIEKLHFFRNNMDPIRTSLMHEPRGHRGMFGCLLTEPTTPEADYGVIFMDSGGYMNMCGMATIGVATALAEMGMVKTQEPSTSVILESPSGLVETNVAWKNGKAEDVSFRNVPAFVDYLDIDLDVPDLGTLKVDVAYGGNYFVFFSAEETHLEVTPRNMAKILDAGIRVREAANQKLPVRHPELKHIDSIYVSTILAPSKNPKAAYKNVHMFGGQFGRSSGGTGTSARMAALYAKGLLKLNQEIWVESITGGLFGGRLIGETTVGNRKAVLPEIKGCAYITGFHQFLIDPDDHLKDGFLIQ